MRTVVAMVSVVLAGLPFGVMVVGLNEQLDAPGRPVQAKLTALLNPPDGVTEMV